MQLSHHEKLHNIVDGLDESQVLLILSFIESLYGSPSSADA